MEENSASFISQPIQILSILADVTKLHQGNNSNNNMDDSVDVTFVDDEVESKFFRSFGVFLLPITEVLVSFDKMGQSSCSHWADKNHLSFSCLGFLFSSNSIHVDILSHSLFDTKFRAADQINVISIHYEVVVWWKILFCIRFP